MGYRDLLKNAVSGLINTQIGDLKDVVTFRSYVSNGYDIDTGLTTNIYNDQPGLSVVCAKFKIDEKDTEVNVLKDERCYIPAKDLLFVPKKTDVIVKANGEAWEFFRVRGVPGDSLWTCYMRLT